MEISEISKLINDVQTKITNISEMIADYENCSNETSKSVLKVAINKLASSFETSTNKQGQ